LPAGLIFEEPILDRENGFEAACWGPQACGATGPARGRPAAISGNYIIPCRKWRCENGVRSSLQEGQEAGRNKDGRDKNGSLPHEIARKRAG